MALSKEVVNYTRCCYIAVEIFPEILRRILQRDIPPRDIEVRASGLRNLTAEERSLLRDASSQGYSNFDMVFLYKIIRNINLPSVTPPGNGWGQLPSTPSNNTIGDIIERIRHLRNKVYPHASSSKMSDKDFNQHWWEFLDICKSVDSSIPSSGATFISLLSDIEKIEFCEETGHLLMALPKETVNYTRCCYVIVEIFTEILRRILQRDIPPHDIEVRASGLRYLTAEERLLLKFASSQGYSNFDVIFLYKIIRNINLPSVTPPCNGWGRLPSTPSNNTIGDVIEIIRHLRNKVYAHAKSNKMSDNEFSQHWSEFIDVCQHVDSSFLSSKPTFCSLLSDIEKIEFSAETDIPLEIQHMDEHSIKIFQEAINQGKYKSYSMRFMTIGHFAAGKTTLTKRLLGKPVDIKSYESTDGIEILDHHCLYDREEKKWIIDEVPQDEAPDLAKTFQKCGINKYLKEETTSETKSARMTEKIESKEASQCEDQHDQGQQEEVDDDMSDSKSDQFYDYEKVDTINKTVLLEMKREPLDNERADVKRRKLFHEIKQDVNIYKNTLEKNHIWDFGGQAALYCTHQAFLSHRPLYILVVDLSKDLQCEIEEEGLDIAKRRKCTVIEYMSFWVNSVKYYAGGKDGFPRIIVIGTHLNDFLNRTEAVKLDALFNEIKSFFKEEIDSGQMVLRKSFMLDLLEDDQAMYDQIRQELSDEAEKQPHWGEELPMSWLPLEHYLDCERKVSQILPMEKVEEYVKSEKMAESLDSREKIDLCLQFLHSRGNIIYYSRPGLNTHLILNPKMLITTLRSLITCSQFCKSPNRKEINDTLAKTGKISKEYIENIWKEKGFEEMYEHKEYLIKVMQELDLLIKPKQYRSGKIVDGDTYYIPSMKTSMAPPDIKDLANDESLTHCTFDFTKSYLPPAVVFRFIGSCIRIWPLAEPESLFYGCCYLRLDDWHRMLLTTEVNKINVTFEHQEDNEYLSRNTTNNVMCIMTEMMKSVISLYPVKEGNTKDIHFLVDKSSVENLKTKQATCDGCDRDCKGPKEDILTEKPTFLQMMRFAKLWADAKDYHGVFATKLGLKLPEMNSIEHNESDNLAMKVFKYCEHWIDNGSGEKSLSVLLTASSSSEEIDGHIICKIMNDTSDYKQMGEIKRDILEDKCTDEVIDQLPQYTGKEYYHFGLELGLEKTKIEEIIHDKKTMINITTAILETAKSTKGGMKIREVACALLRIGRGFSDFKDLVNSRCDTTDVKQTPVVGKKKGRRW